MRHHEYFSHLDGPQSRIENKRRILCKGGGGDSAYYHEANRLYGVQADTADFMLGIGKDYLPGAVSTYAQEAGKYADPAYRDRIVGEAGIRAQEAIDQQNQSLTRNMARYGINPASGKYGSMMNQNAIAGAATKAGAMNQAANYVEDKKFGAAKDFYSSMVGMPSDAASMAGNAASGYVGLGNAKANAKANDSAAMGNIAALGYTALTSDFFRDGGIVKRGPGVKMALGGLFAAGNQTSPPPPSAPAPQQQNNLSSGGLRTALKFAKEGPQGFAGSMAQKGANMIGNISTGAAKIADMTGSQGMAETALNAAGASGTVADVGSQVGAIAAQNATIPGATEATVSALGAGGTEALGAAAGTSPALASISTAVPWVAAAAAVGSMLGLFADGGEVRKDMSPGGEVDGPGGPREDKVPIWASDGEYVINAKAVQAVGKENLDKINAIGLRKKGYADGGIVDKLYGLIGGKAKTEEEKRKEMARKSIGSGMAGQAADKLNATNRNKQIEDEFKRQMGYACGGLVKRRMA